MSLLYTGDIGATISINLNSTVIPDTTDIEVWVTNPNDVTEKWVLETDELNRSTGIITHKSKAGELLYDGEYRVQCREVSSNPVTDVGTTIDSFIVYKRLGA